MIVLILILIALLPYFVYVSSKRKYNYWKQKNVPYADPKPVFGNYKDFILLKKFSGEVSHNICKEFPNEPYVGTFYGSEPALLVQDPELLKLIMTKDYYYFSSREISKYSHKEVFTQNLFFTYGDRWKVIRQNMTPIFTSAKMKNMFYLIENCCHTFEQMLDYEKSLSDVIEVRTLTARFTVEAIGSCAFGVDMKSMGKDHKQNPFIHMGRTILNTSTYSGFKFVCRSMWPAIFYGLGFKFFSPEIDKFFKTFLTNIFQGRSYEPTSRNDFVDCVLNLYKNKTITGDSLSNAVTGGSKKVTLEVDNELLVSMVEVIFAAGFETSSTTSSYVLYELAKDKNAQRRVQEEIDEYLKVRGNKLSYDCITALPFTEACIDEALRLYPVLALLTREVVDNYTFPTGLTVEKDSRVHIPVYHLHHNPEHFPDPETFRPERFLGEEKKKIKPYTYMPFGDGPRICIGMRFAKMQMFAGLVTILKKFSLELAEGTPEKLEFDARSIVTMPIGGLPLKFTIRDGWEERLLQK